MMSSGLVSPGYSEKSFICLACACFLQPKISLSAFPADPVVALNLHLPSSLCLPDSSAVRSLQSKHPLTRAPRTALWGVTWIISSFDPKLNHLHKISLPCKATSPGDSFGRALFNLSHVWSSEMIWILYLSQLLCGDWNYLVVLFLLKISCYFYNSLLRQKVISVP